MPSPELINMVNEADTRHQASSRKAEERRAVAAEREQKKEATREQYSRLREASIAMAERYMPVTPPDYEAESKQMKSMMSPRKEYATPPIALGELPEPDYYDNTHLFAVMGLAFTFDVVKDKLEVPKRRLLRSDTVEVVLKPRYQFQAYEGARLLLFTGTPEEPLSTVIAEESFITGDPSSFSQKELDSMQRFDDLLQAVEAELAQSPSSSL